MAGRPQKQINWDIVELYIKAGCTQKKICEYLGVCKDTLCLKVKEKYNVEYSSFSSGLRSEGEMLLEAAIWQKALNRKSPGDGQVLIWLSKVKLGYKEPEPHRALAENQFEIDQTHRIMQLEHKIAELKNKYESEK